MARNPQVRKTRGNGKESTLLPIAPDSIKLPKPNLKGNKSVAQALAGRKTVREIGSRPISLQLLADLLWSACGINRKKGPFGIPGRTAGSASNSQEIEIYVTTKKGTHLYEASGHKLFYVNSEDLRPFAIGRGQGKAGAGAPVRLIYVVNLLKFLTAGFDEPGLHDPDIQKAYYHVDTGLIAGNVYLFAAANGLATWFHNCDKESLKKKLRLRKNQHALFGQTVGYPT